ncbi:MAG: class I SAM-dependent methyltransferase [Sporocytophaga sp.]|uniref:class I SAM-dependent methyltransferase n=1 Tax=Sporocytophaga sp. TaxID=2231183 RepID=UPI001B2DBEA0|nr:class I SAM-dependent methyltransferase [Sporocytophaga sp.]MBO9701959.1 class I SAM-dependent methyltransferase [Sporocytophaga sp.]
MKYIALIVFVIVQILFLPLSIIGVVILAYKQLSVSKKLGVSATALSALGGRVTANILGIRKDELSGRLYAALPTASIVGFWLYFFPTYIRYRIYPARFEEGKETLTSLVNSIPASRSVYFDKIIEKQKNNVTQFVVMGAGYDMRSYGDLKKSNLKFFELDKANTQKIKIESLDKANIDYSHVAFVDIDFTTEKWYEKLEKSGYDRNKKSLFLWEGVTLYLSENDVRKTIKEIKQHISSGSVMVTDFYDKRFTLIEGIKMTNEMFYFTLDFSKNAESVLKAFVKSENLKLGDFFFMGHKLKEGGAVGVVTEILL